MVAEIHQPMPEPEEGIVSELVPVAKKQGRPRAAYSARYDFQQLRLKDRDRLCAKLAQMGLILDDPSQEIVSLIIRGVPIKGWEERFDVKSYLWRKLIMMVETGYNDRVRLGAAETLAKLAGLVQPGSGSVIQAVEPEWGSDGGPRPVRALETQTTPSNVG